MRFSARKYIVLLLSIVAVSIAAILLASAACRKSAPPAGEPTTLAATKPAVFTLKDAQVGVPISLGLHVSADHRFIAYTSIDPKAILAKTGYRVLHTGSGQSIPTQDLIRGENILVLAGGSDNVKFSPIGSYAVVSAIAISPGEESIAHVCSNFLVDLKTMKYDRLPSGFDVAWVGKSIAISTLSEVAILPIQVATADNPKGQDMNIRGQVLAGDSGGRFLVVLADPKNPGIMVSPAEAAINAHLLLVNLSGTITHDFGEADFKKALVSPSGSYIALWESKYSADVRVISVSGKDDRTIKDLGRILYVSDKGDLLVIASNVKTQTGNSKSAFNISYTLRVYETTGETHVLLPNVKNLIDAYVVGDRLYYAMVDKEGVVTATWCKFESDE